MRPYLKLLAASVLAMFAFTAHAGLFDELGAALGGGAKTAKPDTTKPDTTQTPAQATDNPSGNPTDKSARNLVVTNTTGGKRVALVIGNDRYSTVPQLKNAVADARSMAAELKRAGFDVTLKTDADLDAMKLAVRQFKASLSGGDEAVFFYSGHGVQLGAANYLLPVNIASDNEEQVKDDAIPLQRLLDDLQDQKVKFALAIIDACRDNPFKAAGKRSIGGTRGLAPTSAANGQMVIFSAGNGQQALDKLGEADRDKNGVFTRVFLQEMQKPGLEVHQVVQGVRRRVDEMAKSVKHDQVPAMYDQVVGDFHFYPGIGQGTQVASLIPVPARVKTKEEIEDDYWDDIKDSNDLSSYEQYGKAYPEGRYLNPANLKIAQLKKKIQDAAPAKPVEPIPAPASAPAARVKKSDEEIEDDAWNAVETANTVEAANAYLAGYPKGRYVTQARIKLASLKPTPTKPAEPVAPPIKGDNESALWSEAQKGNSKDDYDAYLTQYPKGKYVALAKSRIKKLQDEAANEAARKEQEAWEAAGKSESEDGYQSYLNGWPTGKYAGLAQVRLRKLQTDLAAAQKKKYEEDAIQQAKQEREAAARQEAERQRQQAEAAQAKQKQEAERQRQQVKAARPVPHLVENRNLAVTPVNNAVSDQRIALVIGNSAYTNSPLKSPVNDAKDMAKKLRGLGFDVIERINLQTKQIGGTLREFRSKLAPGAVALVFYAGYGLQVKGINYLPAVDADIDAEEDVLNQSLSVQQIIDVLEQSKTRLNLVFLDACRNNPYNSRSLGGGLASVSASSGTLISYATRPGSVAADGDGRNSLYTSKLLAQMDSNLQIELALKQVVTAVKAASQGKQEPWMEGSIEGDFCFSGCEAN